ncbi:MAG: hypothetical protein V8Q84_00420 [Bilophila sp.]
MLDETTGKRLLDNLVPLRFDWYRLGRYAMWAAVACILIGVASLFADRGFLEFIGRFISLTGLGRCGLLCLVAAGLFVWGARLRARSPEKRLTSEAVFFLGVAAVAAALHFFADWLYTYDYYPNPHLLYSLFLIAALVYGVLGLALDSPDDLDFLPALPRKLARHAIRLCRRCLLPVHALPHVLYPVWAGAVRRVRAHEAGCLLAPSGGL